MTGNRQGFALVTVLWTVVLLTSLAASLLTISRLEVSLSRARQLLVRSQWAVRGCEAALLSGDSRRLATMFRDSIDLGARTACAISLAPAGTRIDVNTATREQLLGTLLSDSLTDAVLDWRDTDTIPGASGAERAWYLQARRGGPRDAPLRSIRELGLVRGFDSLTLQRSARYLAVGATEGISLSAAPMELLASLPGMTGAALAAIAHARRTGRATRTVEDVLALMPPADRSPFAEGLDALRPLIDERNLTEVTVVSIVDGRACGARAKLLLDLSESRPVVVSRRIE